MWNRDIEGQAGAGRSPGPSAFVRTLVCIINVIVVPIPHPIASDDKKFGGFVVSFLSASLWLYALLEAGMLAQN
jgi:hypothetical protein